MILDMRILQYKIFMNDVSLCCDQNNQSFQTFSIYTEALFKNSCGDILNAANFTDFLIEYNYHFYRNIFQFSRALLAEFPRAE